MSRKYNENGYALLIVLFAVVFITVVTAVFMRGALSNAMQGQTMDKNNLVVVSAEAGVDYYTWNLKQLYDEEVLEAKFNSLVNDYIEAELPVNYDTIQDKIVSDFKTKLESKTGILIKDQEAVLFSKYTHQLTAATVQEKVGEKDDTTYLIVKGTVEGKLLQAGEAKIKDLQFELRFIFPKVFTADGSPPADPDDSKDETGSLISMPTLKTPKMPKTPANPLLPKDVELITKPSTACSTETNNIENINCYFNSKNIANYYVNGSRLYVGEFLTSWQSIEIENSSLYIRNRLEAEKLRLEDTKIFVGSNLKGNNTLQVNKTTMKAGLINNSADLKISNSDVSVSTSITSGKNNIENSTIKINTFNGGTTTFNKVNLYADDKFEVQSSTIENSTILSNSYKSHTSAHFSNMNLKTATSYKSGGASFNNSILEIGTKLDTGGGLFYAEGSDVKIHGDAYTQNGSTIKNSVLEIGTKLDTSGGLFYAEGSDIKIHGDAHTANGSTIKNSVVNIGGYFKHTSKSLDANNSDIFVGGEVSATNGTNFEHVNMIVKGGYESSTKFKLDDSKLIISNSLTLGNGGELEKSLLTAGRIASSTTLQLKGSVVAANHLKSDVMRLDNSKVCTKELEVRDLGMKGDSKIYYQYQDSGQGKVVHTGDNIIKLSPEEFEKKCGIQTGPSPEEPNNTGKIDWKAPVVDKVTY